MQAKSSTMFWKLQVHRDPAYNNKVQQFDVELTSRPSPNTATVAAYTMVDGRWRHHDQAFWGNSVTVGVAGGTAGWAIGPNTLTLYTTRGCQECSQTAIGVFLRI